MKSLLYLIAFLASFFVMLSTYLLAHMRPDTKIKQAEIQPSLVENFTNTTAMDEMYEKSIPRHSDNFMFLSTFFRNTQIVDASMTWYDDDVDTKNFMSTDYNKGTYFLISSPISFIDDALHKGVKGVKLAGAELRGPNALYFANNDNTFELTEFTLLFMIKISAIHGNNILFEMLGNTLAKDTDISDAPLYVPQVISLNLVKKTDSNVRFEIKIGDNVYVSTTDIPNSVLLNELNKIALVFNKTTGEIKLHVNKLPVFNFTYPKTSNSITLGSSLVVVNKDGDLDCTMYSFAYYKKALSEDDILKYEKYNNYYIHGIYLSDESKKEDAKTVTEAENKFRQEKERNDKLTKMLDKCVTDKQIRSYDLKNTESTIPFRNMVLPLI
jgi:hypothetical protein